MKTDMELRQEISHAEKVVRHLRRQLRERKRKAHGLGPRKKGIGCRIGLRDEEATKARKFLDPSSFVRSDAEQTEVCKGKDWLVRKGELRERSGGICEFMFFVGDERNPLSTKYERCASVATIPAHIEPRYPKRDDRLINLMHYCFQHDRETEKQGWRKIRSGKVGA